MAEAEQQLLVEIEATRPVLDQIADKWSVMILGVICTQPARFNAIERRIGGITHKALTQALRRLERNGLVTRRVIASSPVAVEYSITPLGLTLQQPFAALYTWVVGHGSEVGQAQTAYDHRVNGSGSVDQAETGLATAVAVDRKGDALLAATGEAEAD